MNQQALTQRDVEVVLELYKYRYLKTSQIQQLYFPSLQTTNRRLRSLTEQKLVKHFQVPNVSERIYHISQRGASLVANQLGVTAESRKSDFIFDTTEKHLKTLDAPNVSWDTEVVKPGLFKGWMGKKRDFLVVKNKGLKDHKMYIGVRDYGTDLSVSWFLTTEPKYFKGLVSSAVTGSIKALSFALDLF